MVKSSENKKEEVKSKSKSKARVGVKAKTKKPAAKKTAKRIGRVGTAKKSKTVISGKNNHLNSVVPIEVKAATTTASGHRDFVKNFPDLVLEVEPKKTTSSHSVLHGYEAHRPASGPLRRKNEIKNNKNLIIWIGVSSLMLLIFFAWIVSLRSLISSDMKLLSNSDNEASSDIGSLREEFSKAMGEIKMDIQDFGAMTQNLDQAVEQETAAEAEARALEKLKANLEENLSDDNNGFNTENTEKAENKGQSEEQLSEGELNEQQTNEEPKNIPGTLPNN